MGLRRASEVVQGKDSLKRKAEELVEICRVWLALPFKVEWEGIHRPQPSGSYIVFEKHLDKSTSRPRSFWTIKQPYNSLQQALKDEFERAEGDRLHTHHESAPTPAEFTENYP
ncbi:MAG: hypothetical protein J3Q66DRAFT_393462 [Benniella sp.]|nr:MAG: hypothetical protein J3Q66DRAFT_393462 [Benniella sp.]